MNLLAYFFLQAPTPEALKALRLAHPELRRTDRYTQMTLLAANACAAAHDLGGPSTAIVTATAFGTHRTTFAMLDEVIHYPENEILPTKFSHSVLNASAAYLGQILKCTGPAFALCGFHDIFFEAVALAETLFRANLAEQALVIGCDERALFTESLPALVPNLIPQVPDDAVLALLLTPAATPGTRPLQLRRSPTPPASRFSFGCTSAFLNALADVSAVPLTLDATASTVPFREVPSHE